MLFTCCIHYHHQYSHYQDHVKSVVSAAKAEASASMSKAAKKAAEHFDSSDMRASVEGTWQMRGFASKNGTTANEIGSLAQE